MELCAGLDDTEQAFLRSQGGPFWLKPFPFKSFFASAECVKSLFCGAILSVTIKHGQNRKWVLEDNLSQAVWRTILRGPRPPLGSWQRNETEFFIGPSKGHGRVQSGKSTAPTVEQVASFAGFREFRSCAAPAEAQSRRTFFRGPCRGVSSGSRVAGARGGQSRGSIKEALKKAREQCRALPIGKRLDSTLKFVQRSREGTDREDSSRSHT